MAGFRVGTLSAAIPTSAHVGSIADRTVQRIPIAIVDPDENGDVCHRSASTGRLEVEVCKGRLFRRHRPMRRANSLALVAMERTPRLTDAIEIAQGHRLSDDLDGTFGPIVKPVRRDGK